MSYLIDGHNLIPKLPGFSLQAADDEQQLIEWLQIYCRQRRKKIEVFFDRAATGYAGARRYGPVTAHFVERSSSADAAIGKRLAQLGSAARNWTVVTSDHRVQVEARAVHAQVISSEVFASEVLLAVSSASRRAADSPGGLDADEIDEWLRLFGEDDKNERD